MNRARLTLSCAFLFALTSCATSSTLPHNPSTASEREPGAPVAKKAKAAAPVDPLRDPVDEVESDSAAAPAASASAAPAAPAAPAASAEPAASPVAVASASPPLHRAPSEALKPPVDERWGAPKPPARELSARGSMWGGSIGESYGAGGLGLSGVGAGGGGGRGEGIGLGSVGSVGHGAGSGSSGTGFGSGHGRLGGSHAARPPAVRMGSASVSGSAPAQDTPSVKTGEWDDNANFREYTKWLASESWHGIARFDTQSRRFLVVRDASGKPVPSCAVTVKNGAGKSVELLTTSSGRAILFSAGEGLGMGSLVATARCQGTTVSQTFSASAGDGVVEMKLSSDRVMPDAQTLDVAFVLDTTGSMSEEIEAMKSTLQKVADQVKGMNITVRAGLVEYKDRGDEYVTRTHAMTTDIEGLQARIAGVAAAGGGDTPEHVNQAVRAAVRRLKWKSESIARLIFVIGDAPPHLDYQDDEGYSSAVREANHDGIQIFTIAASGMDPIGQVVFRQISQYTGGTHMFVLRGGAGPQSTGAGDPRDSCGGTHSDYRSAALDQLIVSKIRSAIAARDGDPMRIAGLGKDEKEKPCDQRVVMAQ